MSNFGYPAVDPVRKFERIEAERYPASEDFCERDEFGRVAARHRVRVPATPPEPIDPDTIETWEEREHRWQEKCERACAGDQWGKPPEFFSVPSIRDLMSIAEQFPEAWAAMNRRPWER